MKKCKKCKEREIDKYIRDVAELEAEMERDYPVKKSGITKIKYD